MTSTNSCEERVFAAAGQSSSLRRTPPLNAVCAASFRNGDWRLDARATQRRGNVANAPEPVDQASLDIFLALSKNDRDEHTGHCKGPGPPRRARACEPIVRRGAQAHRFNRRASASQFAKGGAADSRQLAVCRCRHRASRRGARGGADAYFQGTDSGHLSRRAIMWTAAVPTLKRLDESSGR